MRRLVCALLILGIQTDAASAIDAKGIYGVIGDGGNSCGKWTQERAQKTLSYYQARGWINGFVTAYNRYAATHQDVAAGIDADGLEGWINNYCAANALSNLATASEALITELATRPQKSK